MKLIHLAWSSTLILSLASADSISTSESTFVVEDSSLLCETVVEVAEVDMAVVLGTVEERTVDD